MLDAFGQPQSIVVLGGTSDIAGAVVERLCARRCRTVVLAARDVERLHFSATRAKEAGADQAVEVVFDAREVASAPTTVDRCFEAAGEVDVVLIAVGVLSGRQNERHAAHSAEVAAVTYAWPVAAATRAAELLVEQGFGRVVFISSVAGVRVRRANFVYGSAKAGLDAFALGLAEVVRGSGVTVQVVRPGFVRTKMTAGMPVAPLATTPEVVADAVVSGLSTSEQIVWVPRALRPLFAVLTRVPETIWKRLPD